MSRLWLCTVEMDLIVQAEDEADAVVLAEEYAPEEFRNGQAEIRIEELTSPAKVPFGWGDSLPYDGDGRETVDEILKEAKR